MFKYLGNVYQGINPTPFNQQPQDRDMASQTRLDMNRRLGIPDISSINVTAPYTTPANFGNYGDGPGWQFNANNVGMLNDDDVAGDVAPVAPVAVPEAIDTVIPGTDVTLRQFGVFLTPNSENSENVHEVFDSMNDVDAALATLRTLLQSYRASNGGNMGVVGDPPDSFVRLALRYIPGNATGQNSELLNNRAYVNRCANRLRDSLNAFVTDPGNDMIRGANTYTAADIVSALSVFIVVALPDNFPNRIQSIGSLFEMILEDAATGHAAMDAVMDQDTPENGLWSCGPGLVDRIFIMLGNIINQNSVNAVVDISPNAIAHLAPAFISGQFLTFLDGRDKDAVGSADQISDLFSNFLIEYFVSQNKLRAASPNYQAIVDAIRARSQLWLDENLEYLGGRRKKRKSHKRFYRKTKGSKTKKRKGKSRKHKVIRRHNQTRKTH
jgi:hypothetical protein